MCAFDEVPGPSAVGVRAEQLLLAFSLNLDVDALSLKGRNLTHIQRVGAARMLRVPVTEPRGADGTAARSAFSERLGAFRRALTRQLENDPYDVVYAVDLFSAAAALPVLGPARLVLEASDVPSAAWDLRYPVGAADEDTRAEWEAAEKAALKAAVLVVAPSRQAARVLSERTDPRLIRVFPRLVDTRLYEPPTVEIDLGDTRTVAFLGGREGGARAAILQSAMKLLATRAPEARFLVVGAPGRADSAIEAMLQTRGLLDRAVLVDVATPVDVQQALSAADVVVVIGDAFGLAMPHRALEAMACARAVVIAAPEVICRDHIVADQHVKVVPPDAPERITETVCALLDDAAERARLGKSAQKQAARFDLGVRMPELAVMLTDATGVPFAVKLPPLDEITAPAPIARAVPAMRVAVAQAAPAAVTSSSSSSSLQQGSSSSQTLRPGISLADVDDWFQAGPTTTPTPHVDDPLGPVTSPAPILSAVRPPAITVGDGRVGDELAAPLAAPLDHLTDATLETSELPALQAAATQRPFVPMSAVRGLTADSAEPGDVWAGDTLFEPATLGSPPSSPRPEKVKRAMLNTDSGATVAASQHGKTGEQPPHRRPSTPGAKSLDLLTGEPSAADDWAPDTIADASPIVGETRVASAERQVITHPPRSFLVEHGVGDMTAEDESER